MRMPVSFIAPSLALAGALTFAACKESTGTSCGSGTAPVVVGTYTLASYTVGITRIDTTMGASGQLRFYASAYGFDASFPVVGAVADSGTYVITGTKCMDETSVMGQGSTSGTFTITGTTPGSVLSFTGTNSLAGTVGFVGVKQ